MAIVTRLTIDIIIAIIAIRDWTFQWYLYS